MFREPLTPYEKAVKKAEVLSDAARKAMLAVGKLTPGVERLIKEADEAWIVVYQMIEEREEIRDGN